MAKLFTDDEALDFINTMLVENGAPSWARSIDTDTAPRLWMFMSTRGKKHICPIVEFAPGMVSIRSILAVARPSARYTWLPNGQAGTNTKEIAFFGEQGPRLVSTKDRLREWAKETWLTAGDEIYEKYAPMMADATVSVWDPATETHAEMRPLQGDPNADINGQPSSGPELAR